MGNNGGLNRAGFMQTAKLSNSIIITSTMGATTCPSAQGWAGFEVISSEAAVAAVSAVGVTNSSLISSGAALPVGSYVGGGQNGFTSIKISTKSTGHKVQAYNRILL